MLNGFPSGLLAGFGGSGILPFGIFAVVGEPNFVLGNISKFLAALSNSVPANGG